MCHVFCGFVVMFSELSLCHVFCGRLKSKKNQIARQANNRANLKKPMCCRKRVSEVLMYNDERRKVIHGEKKARGIEHSVNLV